MRLALSRSVILPALAAALLVPASAQAQSAARYNGSWGVSVLTQQGECDRAYRYTVAIEDGRVRYAGIVSINGSVAGNGAVRGSISGGGTTVAINGRLQGDSGGGTWRATGGRSCSGNWSAERRG